MIYFVHSANPPAAIQSTSYESNEQITLKWAKSSMAELKMEMQELSEIVNNSVLLNELNVMRNEVK